MADSDEADEAAAVVEVEAEAEDIEEIEDVEGIQGDDVAPPGPAVPVPASRESTVPVPSDALQRYLAEIRRYPILSREEEHDLAVRYQRDKDLDAAYALVAGNLRLVVMIAREYQRASQQLLDLIQEGNIGLMEAVKNFDPYRGVRFPSYAVWWIRAYVIRYIMNNWRMVKLGTTQAQRKLFFNLQKEKERIEREGIVPAPKLLAQRLDVKEREVVEMEQRLSGGDVSIDQPLPDREGTSLVDFLPSGEQTAEGRVADAEFRTLVSEKIHAFGKTLHGKERVIFERRLLSDGPGTLQEIGDEFGISRERVRQLESRLKARLREYLLREVKDLKDVDVQAG